MPKTTQILFLRDKSGVFRLRSDVKSFGLDERSGQYYVIFKKGENILYYNPSNVDVAQFTGQLEPPFRVKRKSDGEVFHHILGVRVFQGRENMAYRIIFENGNANNYPADYLSIDEHIDDLRSINVWEYLKEVAKYNVIPLDDDKVVSLADKYSKTEFVVKGSLLEAYLNVETFHDRPHRQEPPIFPFGCNRSQYKAVKNALENKLSIIQGPPGTGKTQTILNIMANLILSGETMQIVSNNNSAVENVKEKLQSADLGFLCAQLGRASNKKDFIDSQTGISPDMESWKLENPAKTLHDVLTLSGELQKQYEYQEILASMSEELSEYKVQLSKLDRKSIPLKKKSPRALQKYFFLCTRMMERKHHLSRLTLLRLRLHGLPTDIDAIHQLLLETRINSIEKQIEEYQSKITDIDSKNERLRSLSMAVLKDFLSHKFGMRKKRTIFSIDEIYLKSKSFLKEYPIVLSTTFSATSNINHSCKFDYLIMDEASQVDIAAGALALSCADSAVIVGDLKQLPNVVDSHTEEIVTSIFLKYNIREPYRYSTNSFLSSICSLYPNIPQVLLREHYRCDPLIIGFCNKQFYNGELIPMKNKDDSLAAVQLVRTASGNHARGTVNHRQVKTVVDEIIPVLEERFSDIGIIAPYNNQVNAIREALAEKGKNYMAATVHKFQGREKDAIILSTVDNKIKEFTDDPHLLNVAVSRARKQFTLVVSAENQPDSNIQNLIDYIEYYQAGEWQSKISSIFDLLYSEYTQDLLNFYKTHRRISEYDSENLTYWLIQDTIKEHGLNHIGILMHYPLRRLITPESPLSEEQRRYASRSWTHLDFLIYDTVSHKARLAIEVDGTRYHRKGSMQANRDMIKNAVLDAIGLPLLRLSTAGAGEKEKIAEALGGCCS